MSQLAALLIKLKEFTNHLNILATSQPSSAIEVNGADKLSGATKESVKATAITPINAHISNKNNPHGVSLTTINAVSKSYVDSQLVSTVSLSELPISQFGDTTDSPLGVTSTGYTLKFTAEIQAYLQGVLGVLPVQDILLNTIHPSPANKTFFAYLGLNEGVLSYRISLERIPESDGTMYLGAITTDASKIASNTIKRVTRLGIYRLSEVSQGSAIPTTSGQYTSPAKISPSWT